MCRREFPDPIPSRPGGEGRRTEPASNFRLTGESNMDASRSIIRATAAAGGSGILPLASAILGAGAAASVWLTIRGLRPQLPEQTARRGAEVVRPRLGEVRPTTQDARLVPLLGVPTESFPATECQCVYRAAATRCRRGGAHGFRLSPCHTTRPINSVTNDFPPFRHFIFGIFVTHFDVYLSRRIYSEWHRCLPYLSNFRLSMLAFHWAKRILGVERSTGEVPGFFCLSCF